MGIKDKWSESTARAREQNLAAEAARNRQVAAKRAAASPGLFVGAKDAWDGGSLCYVHTIRFELTKVRDAEVTAGVNDVLGLGWKLHSTAMTYVERTGLNNITCMFTFVR